MSFAHCRNVQVSRIYRSPSSALPQNLVASRTENGQSKTRRGFPRPGHVERKTPDLNYAIKIEPIGVKRFFIRKFPVAATAITTGAIATAKGAERSVPGRAGARDQLPVRATRPI